MYRFVLDGEAVAVLIQCTSDEQAKLVQAFEQLARHPFPHGLATMLDGDGKENFIIRLDEFLVTFRHDHAVGEIRVADIDRF
jgi:hypothetical protein